MWFTALLPVLNSLIDRLFPDKVEQEKAKLELQKALNESQAKIIDSQKEVLVTEISKEGFTSNWRSYLMFMCTIMIGYSWMGVPILNAILMPFGTSIVSTPIPVELWTLVTIGLGGYIGRETVASFSQAKYGAGNDKHFFDILKKRMFTQGLSQEQVDALNEALQARDGK